MNNHSIAIAMVAFVFGVLTLLALNHTIAVSTLQTEKVLHGQCSLPLSTFCQNLKPMEE